MAEVEEPRFNTLAERIAALNQQKNFQSPSPSAGKRAPPPPPPNRAATEIASNHGSSEKAPAMPPRPMRASTERLPPPLPRRTTDIENGQQTVPSPAPSPRARPMPPPLPGRTPPALPARRPSGQSLAIPPPGRRNSNSSDISYLSTVSSLSLNHSDSPRRLPPPLEQANLPPLPPTRREIEAKAKAEAANNVAPALPRRVTAPPPQTTAGSLPLPNRPSLPPRLPSRPAKSPSVTPSETPSPALPARRLPPPPTSYRPKSALESGFSSGTPRPAAEPTPPPIPLSSRPSLSQIESLRSSSPAVPQRPPPQSSPSAHGCLLCRDFSGPDQVAAQHPVSILPRNDPVSYLAQHLCGPFSSPTDKARAIFTWCHHNIKYDVHGFFNNCIPRGQTPGEMIFSGKAVCEGYARIFESISRKAGLECVVVSGHGKGFGFSPVKRGERVPEKKPTGHAWNAVRIDGGEWKLLDACWGAGALCNNEYLQRFDPSFFTMSNEHFGLRHFPKNDKYWFRQDGRAVSWEEYIVGPLGDEPAMVLGDFAKEGMDEHNVQPAAKKIPVHSGETVRFMFSKICEHWDPIRNGPGKPYLVALKYGVPNDDGKEQIVPLEDDGFWWWLDVAARDLGAPGQQISLVALQTVNGDDARGFERERWLDLYPYCGYSYAYLVMWELV
ncbi:kyphoscoliosis peptidase [Podospora australis]|uniref:Kyphoscoliosis peptidase n=1 Tax=Podospora australis TaxID=1536484 RepID=A0AAN6X0V3_9PEZI|nr:kyphoscoliosis peptidase [Podospora australis]